MNPSLRILNLEDNKTDAELDEAMLSARWPQSELLRVETRPDFVAALERGDVDLIPSDFTMPGFGGMEALALTQTNTDPAKPMECAMICADGSTVPVWVRNSWLTLYDRNLVLRLCREIIER